MRPFSTKKKREKMSALREVDGFNKIFGAICSGHLQAQQKTVHVKPSGLSHGGSVFCYNSRLSNLCYWLRGGHSPYHLDKRQGLVLYGNNCK